MRKIIYLFIIFLFNLLSVDAVVASVGVSCQSLTISPEKVAYAPGETVNLRVVSVGSVSDIKLYWAQATHNLVYYDSTTGSSYWTEIISGSFDPSTKTWSGTWILPNGNGEYLVVSNIINAIGQLCSGNPGYTCSGCENGTEAGPGITAGTIPCNGCKKTVVVDNSYGENTGYDLKKYWNFSPGYSWVYEGINKYSGVTIPFKTRIGVEEKVKMCGGHEVLPVRFTKDKLEGYWQPGGTGEILGDVNLRWFLTYFQEGERWQSTSMGSLYTKSYRFPADRQNPIGELGNFYPSYSVNFRSLDSRDYYYIYFAPYFLSPRYFDGSWRFEQVDRIYGAHNNDYCSLDYHPVGVPRYWNVQYFQENINTPAYQGPGLRVRFIEGHFPLNTGWYIREDWYLAENIGIVQIDEKNLEGKCPYLDGHRDQDCDNLGPMPGPPVRLKLKNYYVGDPLSISVNPTTVPKNGKYTLHVSNNYTGFLEAKSCVSETSCTPGQSFKWGNGDGTFIWVENGVTEADLSKAPWLPEGLYHSYFRPWIDTVPSDTPGETVITKTELPWSNEILIRVGSTPLPGDLNGDGKVDIFDYNLLVTDFGKTGSAGWIAADINADGKVDIFDYNILVGNFGR